MCYLFFAPLIVKDEYTGNSIKTCADHCHSCGKFRGLLCLRCNWYSIHNKMIKWYKENKEPYNEEFFIGFSCKK